MSAKRILIVSPTPTHPRGAGNRARIETMLRSLIDAGHEVSFLHVEREEGDREAMTAAWGARYLRADYQQPKTLGSRLRKRWSRFRNTDGVHDFRIDDWYPPALDAVLEDLQGRQGFDAVIVEYVFMSRALLVFGAPVLKLIDTHDMFTNRHQRYLDEGQRPQWFSTTAAEEGRGFDRADHVIAITDKERAVFAGMTRASVITVGHFIASERRDPATVVPGSLLFVASDNPINVHGLNWFLDEVFPGLRARRPDTELWVVGTVSRQAPARDGVVRKGRIDDLSEVYRQAHVVINPVRFNTGLSIKNLEALAFSRPLVTCVAGADGIEQGVGSAFAAEDEPAAFGETIERILSDPTMAAGMGERAYYAAVAWNNQAMLELNRALDAR